MSTEQYPKFYLYKRIVQAKVFIDNNCTAKIDLNEISDEASFSKFHFIRLFKQIYGMTPHQYLISLRIQKAKELLQQGSSVSEACFEVGFESLSSFSSLFKNTTGKTPSSFIAKHLEHQSELKTFPLKFIPGCMAYKNGFLKNSNFQEGP